MGEALTMRGAMRTTTPATLATTTTTTTRGDERRRAISTQRHAVRARAARSGSTRSEDAKAMKGDGSAEAKKKALARVLDEIDSNFGAGAIMRLGEAGKAKVATEAEDDDEEFFDDDEDVI